MGSAVVVVAGERDAQVGCVMEILTTEEERMVRMTEEISLRVGAADPNRRLGEPGVVQRRIGVDILTTARRTFATTLAERPSTRKPRSIDCLANTVMFALPT
jgi:hypothetical protein